MAAETAVSVKIDTEAGAAYSRLGRRQVGRTIEFDEDIYVDLDQFGVVVGIELLDLDTSLPVDELGDRFHINASAGPGRRLQLAAHCKLLTDAPTADSLMRTLWPRAGGPSRPVGAIADQYARCLKRAFEVVPSAGLAPPSAGSSQKRTG